MIKTKQKELAYMPQLNLKSWILNQTIHVLHDVGDFKTQTTHKLMNYLNKFMFVLRTDLPECVLCLMFYESLVISLKQQ